MTLTPCKGRMKRADARHNRSDPVYHARTLLFAAGSSAGCMALAAARQLAPPMGLGCMVTGRNRWSRTGAR